MTWKENIIALYLHISESESIKKHLNELRQSNNRVFDFTDEEAMTIYIFGIYNKYSKVKEIYRYTKQHLLDWFPSLPSYQAFNNRINVLGSAFCVMATGLMQTVGNALCFLNESVIDSMPIIVAGNKRSSVAKTAPEICGKGFCASKNMYYYGLKLHSIGFVRPDTLPMLEYCWFTSAQVNDLTAAKDILGSIYNRKIYGDKIYYVQEYNKQLESQNNTTILSPIKKAKGQVLQDAADNLFSAAISAIRQPIESFFNWINEKTNIQNATKVRCARGLIAHVWGKMATACALMCQLIFNP